MLSNATILIAATESHEVFQHAHVFQSDHYNVTVVYTSKDVLNHQDLLSFDLLMIDCELTGADTAAFVSSLNQLTKAPIILMTSQKHHQDAIAGLYAGASNILFEPLDQDLLMAKLHVHLRESVRPEFLVAGELRLEPATGRCTVKGEALELTAGQYTLLELLMRERGRIFSRAELEQQLYGKVLTSGTNSIEVFMSHLRKNLAQHGIEDLIKTVRRKGYVIH